MFLPRGKDSGAGEVLGKQRIVYAMPGQMASQTCLTPTVTQLPDFLSGSRGKHT